MRSLIVAPFERNAILLHFIKTCATQKNINRIFDTLYIKFYIFPLDFFMSFMTEYNTRL